ncbi:MAG: hypothetical protein ACXVRH_10890, partial [Thermoleophilaceae bacterium]
MLSHARMIARIPAVLLFAIASCGPSMQHEDHDATPTSEEDAGETPAPPDLADGAVVDTTLHVDPSGSWSVTFLDPAWTFSGSVHGPVSNLHESSGMDAVGAWHEVAFDYADPTARSGAIRAYAGRPVVLFSAGFPVETANHAAFPSISSYPALPYHLTHGASEFAPYSFSTLTADSPWLFFNDPAHAFLISAADHFTNAATTRAADGTLASGIDAQIATLPAGFSHRTILAVGRSIRDTYAAWGDTLLALTGKSRPANDGSVDLKYLGYWTDNGASYYYNYDASKGYVGTLLAIRDAFHDLGLPLGYLQLDSWWYPKGDPGRWDDKTRGLRTLTADPTLFAGGDLVAFQKSLGLPLVVHARWIDSASPYRTQFQMSNDVSTDPAYWAQIAASLKAAGVVTYEQDWLNQRALPRTDNLVDQDAFLDAMAGAMSNAGLSMQYCMPLARHYLQSTRYANLTTMRVSGDDFTPSKWVEFLYGSRLAGALGVWPWADVFMSSEEGNLTLATLSGGIVGVGDALGTIVKANLARAVRSDGVIVKPDAAIAPLDHSFIDGAAGRLDPIVAATRTQHGPLTASYVFAFAFAANLTARFSPSELGYSGDVYVWDVYRTRGRALASSATIAEDVQNGRAYYVVVPVGPSGIAFLGDKDKYVSLGRQRIAALEDHGQVEATVAFSAGESSVTLHGWAPSQPKASAVAGAVGVLAWDAAT